MLMMQFADVHIRKIKRKASLRTKEQTKSLNAGQSRCWATWSLTWAKAVKLKEGALPGTPGSSK